MIEYCVLQDISPWVK